MYKNTIAFCSLKVGKIHLNVNFTLFGKLSYRGLGFKAKRTNLVKQNARHSTLVKISKVKATQLIHPGQTYIKTSN